MKEEKITVQELKDKLNNYQSYINSETKEPYVIMNFDLNFMEVKKSFIEELKNEIDNRLLTFKTGLENPDPITKFAIMILSKTC